MLPIVLNENKVRIVVFGYGAASRMKVAGIERARMHCHVISPDVKVEEDRPLVTFECDAYRVDHLSKGHLIIAATESKETNKRIAEEARRAGKLVLNLSDGSDSDFHMMSWREHGPITVGLSTGSCAPSESKKLIEKLMTVIDDDVVERVILLGSLRKKIKQLGYQPIKPIINAFATLSTEGLELLDGLTLTELSIEIEKELR
ncbi:MAG: hypothetical protein JXO44_10910 [Clostridia bacterium]|nr:hypothetical protein [Clostridia bacterium]